MSIHRVVNIGRGKMTRKYGRWVYGLLGLLGLLGFIGLFGLLGFIGLFGLTQVTL
jgi:hypothetical protein